MSGVGQGTNYDNSDLESQVFEEPEILWLLIRVQTLKYSIERLGVHRMLG